MKKMLAILLCILTVFALACCTDEKAEEKNDTSESSAVETPDAETENVKDKNSEIELDIKPLDEVDSEELSAAAANLGFENPEFFHAFANALGKKPEQVTQQDIDNVHYIAVGPEETGYSVYIGYIDYVDLCFSEESNMDDIMSKLNDLVMMSVFEYDKETDTLSDLGNFKNVEMFEIYDVEIDDVSFVKNYPILALGYFKNNGITDVSSLSDYNPESLVELDFTGNSINDWTPLYNIKDKVTVFYGVADGMPMTITLENMLEQKQQAQDTPADENMELEEEKKPVELVDENGNPADFSSLFD